MADDVKTAREIAEAIKGQAAVSLGPWPRDLELFIFGAKDSWSCGLSSCQTSQRHRIPRRSPADRKGVAKGSSFHEVKVAAS